MRRACSAGAAGLGPLGAGSARSVGRIPSGAHSHLGTPQAQPFLLRTRYSSCAARPRPATVLRSGSGSAPDRIAVAMSLLEPGHLLRERHAGTGHERVVRAPSCPAAATERSTTMGAHVSLRLAPRSARSRESSSRRCRGSTRGARGRRATSERRPAPSPSCSTHRPAYREAPAPPRGASGERGRRSPRRSRDGPRCRGGLGPGAAGRASVGDTAQATRAQSARVRQAAVRLHGWLHAPRGHARRRARPLWP